MSGGFGPPMKSTNYKIFEKIRQKMKISKITRVPVERLRINEGQLDWLPRNPRQWTQTDIDRMVKSVEEDPDFADVRPVLATPAKDGTLIVFAHNLLTKAAQVRGDKTLPVATFTPETEKDQETIRRLALKDNGTFGSWDTEILANDWDFEPFKMEEWGIPEWVTGGVGKTTPPPSQSKTGEINPGGLPQTVPFTVELSPEEFSFVKRVINEAGDTEREGLLKLLKYGEV